jgi:ubiquinone/menaquinone biosynthesis C-methylase UbiE
MVKAYKCRKRGNIMEQQGELPMTEVELFQVGKEKIRKRLLKYARRAFRMLPKMDKPRILDIGCGSGIPTLELAKLSQGNIIGIDIDQPALDRFTSKVKEAGLAARVQAVNCSILDMDFPDECFDIIWSEGSIFVIGFESGLKEWKRFLKSDGFMVTHDEKGNISEKLGQISNNGYELLGYFILDEDIWCTEYFAPLEKLVNETRSKYPYDQSVLEEIQQAQVELDMYKKYPDRNSSVYFVMKKN